VLRAVAAIAADGKPISDACKDGMTRLLDAGFSSVDYLEMRAADNLTLLQTADRPARVFAAAYLGKARLIDNVVVV
jgi:pantoate--beta-alanine ligase